MAPGTLLEHNFASADWRPSKKIKMSPAADFQYEDSEEIAVAVPTHPLGIRPAGNAYTATENLKSRCGAFARLPDELMSHMLESFEADVLVRLGSTCKALYAFTRLDELWRALFVGYVTIYFRSLKSFYQRSWFLCVGKELFSFCKTSGLKVLGWGAV